MASDGKTIEDTARALLAHRAKGGPLAVPWAMQVNDLETGYAVQAEAARIRVAGGDRVVGWKIGATGAPARALLGVSGPFFGRIFASMVGGPGAVLPANGPWVVHEPEIGLVMARDLPDIGTPYDAAAVMAATRAVVPAIEVVGSWFSPWNAAGPGNLVADNGAFGHWVHGAEVPGVAGLDLTDAPISLAIDGAVVATGSGKNVEGGVFAVTAWLANALIAQGEMLRAGDYVTTGTTTPPQKAAPGQHVEADFGALGKVALSIAP